MRTYKGQVDPRTLMVKLVLLKCNPIMELQDQITGSFVYLSADTTYMYLGADTTL